jgi:hypothetical protein
MIKLSENSMIGKPLQIDSQVMGSSNNSPSITGETVGSATSGMYSSNIQVSTEAHVFNSAVMQIYPRIKKDTKARVSLTSNLLPLSLPLQAIIISGAAEVGFPLERLEWTAFKYKDQKRTDVVLKVISSANRQQALAFWDFIGERVDDWITRISNRQVEILQDRLSFEIVWR